MKGKQSSNKSVLWWILGVVAVVVLGYLFFVAYAYWFSPYDISLKLIAWPFNSDAKISELYKDSMVEISFKIDKDFDEEEQRIIGVNVRKDGFVVAPYEVFRLNSGEEIFIKANSGKVYRGNLLFFDENMNLAILKCEQMPGDSGKIAIPFVKIQEFQDLLGEEVFAITSPMEDVKNFWIGEVVGANPVSVYSSIEVGDYFAVDKVMEECYQMDLGADADYTGGAVFDSNGGLLGLSFSSLENENYFIMPVYMVNYFLQDVVDSYCAQNTYSNALVESFVGFDQIEITCHILVSSEPEKNGVIGNLNQFYFQGAWKDYNEYIRAFYASDGGGYYLMENLTYDGSVKVRAGSVITKVTLNGVAQFIYSKQDLFNILYQAESGDVLQVDYFALWYGRAGQATFTV